MYGITECDRVSIAEPDADLADPLSLGPPLPGTDVIVVDDHGEPVPVGTTGQLVVRGPHVMSGYWRAPELTRQRFRPDPVTGGTLLFTGDYGSVSDAGDLRFVGRRDDIIKRRGTRVSTLEVEAAALDVPGVEDAAAMVGLPSDELLLFASGTVEQQALVNGLADRLEFAKRPDRCVVVDRLPLGPNGKADRTALGALVTAAPGSERGTHHDVRA